MWALSKTNSYFNVYISTWFHCAKFTRVLSISLSSILVFSVPYQVSGCARNKNRYILITFEYMTEKSVCHKHISRSQNWHTIGIAATYTAVMWCCHDGNRDAAVVVFLCALYHFNRSNYTLSPYSYPYASGMVY